MPNAMKQLIGMFMILFCFACFAAEAQELVTGEEFVDSVIYDVGKRYKIRDGWVFTLGWSSNGHVLYSSSFENPKIRGSFIAMDGEGSRE
jgi:hypothetical protein